MKLENRTKNILIEAFLLGCNCNNSPLTEADVEEQLDELALAQGYSGFKHFSKEQLNNDTNQIRRWNIWAEGFRATGQSGKALLIDSVVADSFKSAVAKLKEHPYHGQYINVDSLTYWGCRLFDNESDSRTRFG